METETHKVTDQEEGTTCLHYVRLELVLSARGRGNLLWNECKHNYSQICEVDWCQDYKEDAIVGDASLLALVSKHNSQAYQTEPLSSALKHKHWQECFLNQKLC